MELDCIIAEFELKKAEKSTPGLRAAHSRFVALA